MLSSSERCHRTKRLQDADAKMQLNMRKKWLMKDFEEHTAAWGGMSFMYQPYFSKV